MPEPAHKRQLTSTVYTNPLMTPTTAFGLSIRLSMFELQETGDWDIFPWNYYDFGKIKWETSDFENTGKIVQKTRNSCGMSGNQRKKTRGNSGPTPVARGGSPTKAPPLAVRPVPWNGRRRKLVEVTDGCYSGGDSQGLLG